jgi:hypothetical protein
MILPGEDIQMRVSAATLFKPPELGWRTCSSCRLGSRCCLQYTQRVLDRTTTGRSRSRSPKALSDASLCALATAEPTAQAGRPLCHASGRPRPDPL